MGNKIVYQIPDQPVAIMTPCDCGLSLEQIGKKDVPSGVPFWIVSDDSIPSDRSMRNAWELAVEYMGEPSGFGGTA